MRRRTFLLGSAAFASAGLFTGADALSSTTTTRRVSVAVVDDPDAYLGLDESGVETDLLFSGDARAAPVEFKMQNGLPDRVTVTITLGEPEEHDVFAFADGSNGSTELRLNSGEDETVTVKLAGEPVEPVTDTLSFSVEGESVAIDATRELTLKPEEIDADVRLANTEAVLNFHRPSADLVDLDSVTVTTEDGATIQTTRKGNSDNLTLAQDGQDVPGCEEPNGTVSLTVEGRTVDGIDFLDSLDDVNCSGSNGNGGNGQEGSGNNGNSETEKDGAEKENKEEDD